MERTTDAVSSLDDHRRRFLPAWAASVVLHIVIFVVLGLTMRFVPQGISGETSREAAGEIVLKHHTEQGDYYESQSDSKASAAAAQSAENLLNESSPFNPSVALPFEGIGNPPARSKLGGGSGDFLDNPSPPRLGTGKGTKTKFFDIKSQGNSFVFVIDRSASMNHSGRLAAAKADLLAALSHLEKTNQFQLIFYNSGLTTFRPRGNRPFFADAPTMELARRFVNGITADGPSDGFRQALHKALLYGPDVIYFLTDAEDIRLSSNELALLRGRNRASAVIHTIKFGEGAVEQVDWLVNLAKQSGGEYRYVDSGKFRSNR